MFGSWGMLGCVGGIIGPGGACFMGLGRVVSCWAGWLVVGQGSWLLGRAVGCWTGRLVVGQGGWLLASAASFVPPPPCPLNPSTPT